MENDNVPAKFQDIISKIESLSVLDLAELVKVLEKKFGVSAAPAMMAAPVGGGASAGEAAEEKTSFDVVLTSGGGQKIQVIKVLREATGLGLKEAKDLVDAPGKTIKQGVAKAEADELKKKLEETGATVEIK